MPLFSLSNECFNNILIFLDIQSLYNCLFVNRHLCRHSVPILWRDPFNHSVRKELIDTLLSCLVEDEISSLIPCVINFSNQSSLFKYGKYIRIINNSNYIQSIRNWLTSSNDLKVRLTAIDCRVQKLSNVIYHSIMKQGSNLQGIELNISQDDDLPKFSTFTTYNPGITKLRSLDVFMNPSYKMEYQNTIEFLSMVSKFCNGIVNCNIWIYKLGGTIFKPLLDIIELQPLEKMSIGNNKGEDIKEIIYALEFRSNTLKQLNIGFLDFQDINLSFISKFKCLEQLGFATCKGFVSCEGLPRKKFQLKELLLIYDDHDYNTGMRLSVIEAMIKYLCSETLLKLTFNVITQETVMVVKESCPNLSFLSIRIFSDQFLNSIIPLICEITSLKTLRIEIGFDKANAGLIAKILGDYMTSVVYLFLEFQIDLLSFEYFTNNCKADLRKWIIQGENSWKYYLECINNYQQSHNSLRALGMKAYNDGMDMKNLTNEELKIIKSLKNQGVDVVSSSELEMLFNDYF